MGVPFRQSTSTGSATMSNRPRSVSLLDALIRAVAPERRPDPRPARRDDPAPTPKAPQSANEPEIVDRRDESGVKHRGDFPNPSGGAYKGCF